MKIFLICISIITASVCQAARWSNWAKNQSCTTTIVQPSTTQELIALVKKAQKEKSTMRAYGSGHSWSNIVCNDGYVINTQRLNKVLSIDTNKALVTVQAGIKIEDLNTYLAQHGLCLSNQAAVASQTIAGAIATATHGSGKTGTLASFITQVRMITADAQHLTISATQHPEFFGAVRTSIGSLGIVTELTIQCEPLFSVKREDTVISWDTMIREHKNLWQNNDFMQLYWNVSDDSVEVTIHNRVDKNNNNDASIGLSYQMLSGSLGGFYLEEEIAVPLARFVEAAHAIRKLMQKESKKNSLFSGVLFRFVAADKHNYLSPASNQNVVFFSITTTGRTGYERFYRQFYRLMLSFNGRPHWGKINYLTYRDALKLYGQDFKQFISIRKKLDPHGLFSNAFTKTVLKSSLKKELPNDKNRS